MHRIFVHVVTRSSIQREDFQMIKCTVRIVNILGIINITNKRGVGYGIIKNGRKRCD